MSATEEADGPTARAASPGWASPGSAAVGSAAVGSAWRGGPDIPRPRASHRRRGLVLGGGGVLGFAWMVGALRALEEQEGFDARDVDVVVGTSAGSIMAALLGLGTASDAVLRHQRGIPLPGDPRIDWNYDTDAGRALPPRPGFGLGSRGLLLQVARHPRRLPPLAAMSAVFPRGRGTLHPIGRMIDAAVAVTEHDHSDAGPAGGAGAAGGAGRAGGAAGGAGPDGAAGLAGGAGAAGDTGRAGGREGDGDASGRWPVAPRTWIVTMDYTRGQRVAFGSPGAPPARLSDAVMASCAIPGWYTPVRIGGQPYVDGGTFSPTSLDLLADEGLDEVWVLAPMVSFAVDRPRSTAARLERRFRRLATRRVLREAVRLQRAGTAVTILGPGPEDLEAMGANLMDPARRVDVLVTSLRTSAEALRTASPLGAAAGGLGAS